VNAIEEAGERRRWNHTLTKTSRTGLHPRHRQHMGIQKQDFYEGAALYILLRSGDVRTIRHDAPYFIINDKTLVYIKYSTRKRSPWAFSVAPEEQLSLQSAAKEAPLFLGLVCGDDGVAALAFQHYMAVAAPRPTSAHLACYRNHGEHYEIRGPDGRLPHKIAPSEWQRLARM
jgi:hypothetical protein